MSDNNTEQKNSLAEFVTKLLAIIHSEFPNNSFVFSPISISIALAMLYAGARGVTRCELERVVFGSANSPRIHAFYAAEIARLNESDELFALELANKFYAQNDYPLANRFIELVETNYVDLLKHVDFSDSVAVAQLINEYVAAKTHNKIPHLLSPHDVANIELMPLSVAYFRGAWRDAFQKSATKKMPFFVTENEEKQVWMMRDSKKANYYENDRIQMLVLPYKSMDQPKMYTTISKADAAKMNIKERKSRQIPCFTLDELEGCKKHLEMCFVLPKRRHALGDAISALVERSGANGLSAMRAACKECAVEITLPKFKIDFLTNVNKMIVELGANSFAEKTQDYRGMSAKSENPIVGAVFHRAVIEVNEEDTEAAAATCALAPISAKLYGAGKYVKFEANHPFAFAVTVRDTALFVGMARM